MSIIRDEKLADYGRMKIEWVQDFMPTLSAIRKRFAAEKPFAGKKIAMSIHMEAKTAYLALCLKEGGAEVHATGCNPLSTQDDVAAGLASLGVNVYCLHAASPAEYTAHLAAALACEPDLIIDDGGDLLELLCGEYAALGKHIIGGCEETTTGVHRLRAREQAGALPFAMMDVNDAKCKHYYDNRYGTGQSVWDAIMHTTNLLVAGRTVVVAGYGWCGRGIAMRAAGMGAHVVVTEIDPVKALEATMDGYRVMPMDDAAKIGDLFVTATGCRDIITARHFAVMKNNALLCNAGHFNVEVDGQALENMAIRVYPRREEIMGYALSDGRTLNLLAEGRLVNLASGNGHPAEIMDMSFAIQAMSLEYLLRNGATLEKKVYDVPEEIDDLVGWTKLHAMGLEIDRLTDAQREYLSGWQVSCVDNVELRLYNPDN
ncbi:MAG: adenosylhomocysteinase [Oscillospiraceae bacterium]|nr:adenosylhomocysteinase [Oscillospiraceae bacterium]